MLAQPGEGPFILKTHFTRHWEVFSTLENQEQDRTVCHVGLPPLQRQKLPKESKFIVMSAVMAVGEGQMEQVQLCLQSLSFCGGALP